MTMLLAAVLTTLACCHIAAGYYLPREQLVVIPQGGWEVQPDPSFYILSETDPDVLQGVRRVKRQPPQLSINNPMDVLRQRVLLELARRRLNESKKLVQENRARLDTLGKRDGSLSRSLGTVSDWESSNPHWDEISSRES